MGGTRSATADPQTVLAEFGITRSLAVQFTFVGTLGFVAALGVFGGLYALVTGTAPTFTFVLVDAAWWSGALSALVFLVLASSILAPHELCHGLAIRYYGGKPRYGVGLAHFILPYAYATTDHEFTRNQFVVVLFAPLVGLTALGVPLMLALEWDWLLVPLAANAGGAVGDLWMALTVLRFPGRVTVTDHADGFRIVGFPGDGPRNVSITAVAWDALAGAATASVGLLLLLGFVGPFAMAALGIQSLSIGTEGTITFLFAYVETADSVTYSVGSGVLVLGAIAGVAYALVNSARRQRRVAADEPPD